MEMHSIFNVLSDSGSDPFIEEQQGNAIEDTVSTNHDDPREIDAAANAIHHRSPMDIASDHTDHFTITPKTTNAITPATSRRNGYTAFDNIASFGISISVIVHTL